MVGGEAVGAEVSADELARVRWTGESNYRVLSYYFTLRWNRAPIGEYVHHVLQGFAVPPDPAEMRIPPTPGMPPTYNLVDLGKFAERRYRLLYPETPLSASDAVGDVLHHLFWHVNSEAIRRTGNFLLIHAGSVVSPTGHGVLLPGGTGSGKTTLAMGLVRAGFGYLSDEAGAIDPVGGRVYPYPKALTLKRDPAELLPGLRLGNGHRRMMRGVWHVRAEDLRPAALPGPTEARLVVFPRYDPDAARAGLASISRAEGVVALAENTLNLAVYGSRALRLLGRVARRARFYRLVSGDLDEAVRSIVRLTRGRRPS